MTHTGRTRAVRLRRPGCRRWADRGAALVEFAIIAPLFFVLVMGMLDFGLTLSNSGALREGVADSARQAAVANFGTTSSCGASLVVTGSADMQKLVCLTQANTGMAANSVAVAIRFSPSSASYPAPVTGSAAPIGNGIVVCSVMPMTSSTKLFSPILDGKYIKAKAVSRIEKGSGVVESQANETDPTGANWSWCTG